MAAGDPSRHAAAVAPIDLSLKPGIVWRMSVTLTGLDPSRKGSCRILLRWAGGLVELNRSTAPLLRNRYRGQWQLRVDGASGGTTDAGMLPRRHCLFQRSTKQRATVFAAHGLDLSFHGYIRPLEVRGALHY
jgi:hypothetical protein